MIPIVAGSPGFGIDLYIDDVNDDTNSYRFSRFGINFIDDVLRDVFIDDKQLWY